MFLYLNQFLSRITTFIWSMFLSKKVYNQVEAASLGPWELSNELTQQIQYTVENLFSQCRVYSKDLDSKLNLVDEL